MLKADISGVYAITDTATNTLQEVLGLCERWLAAGVKFVQFRDKTLSPEKSYELAAALRVLCDEAGASLIVNDDVALAKRVSAHGVHLGKSDIGLEDAREVLGPGAIIGVSCYNSISRAHRAEEGGADYVAFGAFFPSSTKPDAEHAGTPVVRLAKSVLHIPVVGIGGINASNAAAVVGAGVDAVAVISAVNKAVKLEAEIQQLQALFDQDGKSTQRRFG